MTLEEVHNIATVSSAPIWRSILATVAAAGAFGLMLLDARTLLAADTEAPAISMLPATLGAGADANAVRSFSINVPEEALVDLRRRIAATRWPDRETVTDDSQGVQLATIQALARY